MTDRDMWQEVRPDETWQDIADRWNAGHPEYAPAAAEETRRRASYWLWLRSCGDSRKTCSKPCTRLDAWLAGDHERKPRCNAVCVVEPTVKANVAEMEAAQKRRLR